MVKNAKNKTTSKVKVKARLWVSEISYDISGYIFQNISVEILLLQYYSNSVWAKNIWSGILKPNSPDIKKFLAKDTNEDK